MIPPTEARPMGHTPEPWTLTHRMDTYHVGNDKVKHTIMDSESNHFPCNVDVTRIVSCVNGCQGLNPAAFRAVVEALKASADFIDAHLPNRRDEYQDFTQADRALTAAEATQP